MAESSANQAADTSEARASTVLDPMDEMQQIITETRAALKRFEKWPAGVRAAVLFNLNKVYGAK